MITDFIAYILIVFFILFFCAKISYNLGLVDIPNIRKIHSKDTAFTGGIGLSVAFIFAIFITDLSNNNLNLILSIGFLVSLVGFIDDKYTLNAGSKLCLQILPIFYLIIIENLFLNNLGDYDYFKINL